MWLYALWWGRSTVSVALALAVTVLLILFVVYQSRIEEWLRPFADWMHEYAIISTLPYVTVR